MARLEENRVDGHGNGAHMFIPGMCPIAARFVAGVFRSIGYNAEVATLDEEALSIGSKHTAGGECAPCPCTTGAIVREIQNRKLDPEKVVLFMPTACGPCRFGQYGVLDKIILEKIGFDKVRLLSPSAENAYAGVDPAARKNIFHALVAGDVVRKMGMKLRPYEVNKGEVDEKLEGWTRKIEKEFENKNHTVPSLIASMADDMKTVALKNEKRPLIGIVGEIFVRTEPFINMNLYRRIEELGGEAWLAPLSEWILYTSECSALVAKEQGAGIIAKAKNWLENHWFLSVEKTYYDAADAILHDRKEPHIPEIMDIGKKYIPWQFEGEAILTLGRAIMFKTLNGASAVVNASPMFCMPGTVTTSIFPEIEKEYDFPVLCNFYDGSGDPNQSLVPCMHYLCEKMEKENLATV